MFHFEGIFTIVKSFILKLNLFPSKPWILQVCSTSLLKTLWEKEQFLLFPQCFLLNQKLYPRLSIFMTSYRYLLLNWESLFTQCFQKSSFPDPSKGVIVWEWVKLDKQPKYCWSRFFQS